ncbi:MAG: hypothetical protein JO338_05440 [Aquitalea sp.]|nr:hypothetical protein [Aquitalea sp.]
MTATLGGWVLILLLVAYYLHILWRQIAGRSPVAIASFIAGYFMLATLFRQSDPYQVLRPIWLPFIYCYAWLACSALLWLPASARLSRRGLSFPEEPPHITALLVSQLMLSIGTLLTSPLLDWRPMAAYVMLPPVMVVISYLLYRLFAFRLQARREQPLSWSLLLASMVLSPLCSMLLGGWLAPYLLGWT